MIQDKFWEDPSMERAFTTMKTVAYLNLALGYEVGPTSMAASIADKLGLKADDGSVPFYLLKMAQEAIVVARERETLVTKGVMIILSSDGSDFDELEEIFSDGES